MYNDSAMKIVGHEKILAEHLNLAEKGLISQAYLFVGPKHIGKTTVAKELGHTLLCQASSKKPCGFCENCRLFSGGNLPDLLIDDSEEGIGVEEIRQLIKFLDLASYRSSQKVALIGQAERMTEQAANAFLKTLEEPAQTTTIILTAEKEDNLLETIVSRCQTVRFNIPAEEAVREHLSRELSLPKEQIDELIKLSGGRIGLAIMISQDDKRIARTKELLSDFLEANDGGYKKKFNFVDKYAKSENLISDLEVLENYFYYQMSRKEMSGEERLKITHILDRIAKSKEYFYRNINPGTILGSLVI